MGFLDDVKKIMRQCPSEKQTLLYSATIQREIEYLAKEFMNNPIKISVTKYVDPKKLHQEYYDVPSNLKFSLLAHLLKQEGSHSGLIMVFTNSRTYADTVAKNLNSIGINAFALHGGLTQQRRNAVLEKFNKKDKFVLTCTDVAARGLDIPGVTHVYNYDIPNDTKQYVHRIGRTARAGSDGKVINLLSSRDYDNFGRIFQENSFDIKKMDRPRIDRIAIKQDNSRKSYSKPSNFYRGGRDGSRSGGRDGGSGSFHNSRRDSSGSGGSGFRSSSPRRGGYSSNRRDSSRRSR